MEEHGHLHEEEFEPVEHVYPWIVDGVLEVRVDQKDNKPDKIDGSDELGNPVDQDWPAVWIVAVWKAIDYRRFTLSWHVSEHR